MGSRVIDFGTLAHQEESIAEMSLSMSPCFSIRRKLLLLSLPRRDGETHKKDEDVLDDDGGVETPQRGGDVPFTSSPRKEPSPSLAQRRTRFPIYLIDLVMRRWRLMP